VLLPCYNEEVAITAVIDGFRAALPDSKVYVFDNNSSDKTAEVARDAGAIVYSERRQGKGYVVRRMFADIDADIYVLADGDNTYDAASAPRLVQKLVDENLDMVVGKRVEVENTGSGAYRLGHRFGNQLFTRTVAFLFGQRFTDILSGYRVFSKRYVKSFPSTSKGFEIETELTIHSLDLELPVDEVETPYAERPDGSESKLNSFADGFRILLTIILLLKENRPFMFFGSLFALCAITSVGLAVPLFMTYLETGLVPRFPTAVLSTGLMLIGFMCLVCGLILDGISLQRREAKLLRYLSLPTFKPESDRS